MPGITTPPTAVLHAFFPAGTRSVRLLDGGMVNTTFLVETDQRKIILQRLAPIFSMAVADDYRVVSARLASEGWEIPLPVLTTDKQSAVTNPAGRVWRAISYVQSDTLANPAVAYNPQAYGRLLGKLHNSLAAIAYTPAFTLPHFHDAAHYANNLAAVLPALPGKSARKFARSLLGSYASIPQPPSATPQLIHGDPRTANILVRSGEPFTFIDWDTLMTGSPYTDLGDLLRSLCEDAILAGRAVPETGLEAAVEAYRQEAFPKSKPAEFRIQALQAGQLIAIELAMRFAADYRDGDAGYFAWDQADYPSRHAYTLAQAEVQWSIYCILKRLMV